MTAKIKSITRLGDFRRIDLGYVSRFISRNTFYTFYRCHKNRDRSDLFLVLQRLFLAGLIVFPDRQYPQAHPVLIRWYISSHFFQISMRPLSFAFRFSHGQSQGSFLFLILPIFFHQIFLPFLHLLLRILKFIATVAKKTTPFIDHGSHTIQKNILVSYPQESSQGMLYQAAYSKITFSAML